MHRKSTGVEKYLFRSKESVALGSVLYVKDGVLYRSWGWGEEETVFCYESSFKRCRDCLDMDFNSLLSLTSCLKF